MILLSVILSLVIANPSPAAEGFKPSYEKNVVMLKGPFSGASAFFLNTPSHGIVLVTQKHVLDHNELTIQHGNAVGMLFRLKVVEPEAYQRAFVPEKIWESSELDITVLKPSVDLIGLCRCAGFKAAPIAKGPASLVGYPITELRIYPRANRIFSLWRQLGQEVTQQSSEGEITEKAGELFGDMDALPGNSGGPVLDRNGKVIGIVHRVLAEKEQGFKYTNPSLSLIPIQMVLKALSGVKAR